MRKYRYAEKCLYSYKENETELFIMEQRLHDLRNGCDVHGYMYEASGSSGGVSDPVSSYVGQIVALERRVMRQMRRVVPVRRLREAVKGSCRRNEYHRQILERYYFDREPMTRLLASLHWSRSAFFARRYDLVCRLIELLEDEH